jgi:hypothetical protein
MTLAAVYNPIVVNVQTRYGTRLAKLDVKYPSRGGALLAASADAAGTQEAR